jgi:hypothetical protein
VSSPSMSARIYVIQAPQQFRAVKTNHGWAFQHVQTQQYLGIPHTTVRADEAARIVGVAKPFTWMIIPYHMDRGNFKYVKMN